MNTETNELAGVVVNPETPLKQMLLEYVGNKFATEEDEGEFEVTVQMIVETLAHEFPEFVMIMAEENWVRGYQQGIDDASRLHTAAPEDA
jgi:Zn-dependent peptidase ImmA (M78 family)